MSEKRLPPEPFDLCGPLPTGTTVLEASAGTGKTFTIAALVTRFVAEDVAGLDQMLIVTFSRAATSELRERVRERLTSAERGLADVESARNATADGLLRHLAGAPEAEVIQRRRRLSAALATFDAATIATTHQFCAQVLAGLGVTADLAGGERFVESIADLVDEVAEDLYVRKFAPGTASDGAPAIEWKMASRIAREVALRDPQAGLEPQGAPDDSPAGLRRRLAEAVREEVRRRKRTRGLRSYDDLQVDLAEVLAHPRFGAAAADRLRERFPVVLIDEFQDTDPVQWEIVRRAFVGRVRLVLIGDPKQAIYGFRGADVTAYLKAAQSAGVVATLERNWRSEQRLLDAFDALFGKCTFGDARIAYRPVQAARPEEQLRAEPVAAPLRIRLVPRQPGDALTGKGLLRVKALRLQIADDVAADVVALLESTTDVQATKGNASKGFRGIEPRDIAVLVRTNAQADMVRVALGARGVPAVIGGTSSVFATPIARDWLILLEALEQPHRIGRVKAAAMSCFLDWPAERIALAEAAETDALTTLVRGWAHVLATHGVAALQETVTGSQGLPARMLSQPDGERRLTDLRHIGEVLHGAVTAENLGITALIGWLRRRIEEAREPVDGVEERSRRLDSDADAVQVVTIHRSKGLEFPVVYVPFGWDESTPVPELPRYHDAAGERMLDVGCGLGGSDVQAHREGIFRHQIEESGEQLRLLYVALTRARSKAVLWWAPATTAECAPLTRLLFGSLGEGGELARSAAIPSDSEAARLVTERAAGSPGRIAVERALTATSAGWRGRPQAVGELSAARFDRSLDLNWRRTSYSALTAAAHDAGSALGSAGPAVGSEPDDGALDDEPTEEPVVVAAPVAVKHPADAVVSPMARLPGGTSFGSLVHGVFETVDTSVADLPAEISARLEEQLARWAPGLGPAAPIDPAELAQALVAVYDTPLGPGAEGLRLRDFSPTDRLTELGFELPLVGGDRPAADLKLAAIGPLLRRHLAGGGPPDRLAAYSDRFDDPLLRDQPLRGFLSGSLDAVLRVRSASDPKVLRYLVVDYKTNWLGTSPAGSGLLTAADYAPAQLTAAMLDSDYPLQALLYSVALHRYLRWRQPGYDPDVHLGGVLYLYVRGMCGAGTPVIDGQPCGVFAWHPPAGLVIELSGLLDRGRIAA